MRRLSSLLTAAALLVGTAVVVPAAASAAPSQASGKASKSASGKASRKAVTARAVAPEVASTTPGTYVAVAPFRPVDTRSGTTANPTTRGALKAHAADAVKIGGFGSVPASRVSAVAVTIHVVSTTSWGSITAWPTGTTRPGTSNVLFVTGQNASGFAVVPVSASGAIDLYNGGASGSAQVIVDVSGYYVAGSSSAAGAFHAVSPRRAVANHVLGAHAANSLATGVAASGVGAVAVMITAASPAQSGSLIAYPDNGSARPAQETTRFVKGRAVTTFAMLRASTSGRIEVYNNSTGSVTVSIDVVGYTSAGVSTTAATLVPVPPARVANAYRLAAHGTKLIPMFGRAGVPRARVAAVLAEITVTSPTRDGSVVAWSGAPSARPGTNSMLVTANTTTTDVALVPVAANGTIGIGSNASGAMTVTVDIYGYLPANALAVPVASVSRYLGDLKGTSADLSTMATHGCADADNGARFVLLDVGAQSVTSSLSTKNPGVALALTNPTVRLDYADLVARIEAYLDNFDRCQHSPATIAVGTNNSGSFSGANAYDATARGTAWSTQVVTPLGDYAATKTDLTVVGANDIENGNPETDGFDTVFANAQKWEAAYLAAGKQPLVFNGSANGCPTAYNVTSATCQDGWTMAQIRSLAAGTRVQVLPQVFYSTQAVQWADLDAAGSTPLNFLGALTEHSLDPGTFTAQDGWAALTRALATTRTNPPALLSTDITSGSGSDLAEVRGVPYR